MGDSDFPKMGDFPTIGSEKQSAPKQKSEMSGSYNSMAKDSSAPEKGSGISFSKGGPPVFTSKKKKTADPIELAASTQGAQNYDFSKMNLSSASVKRVEGEEETVTTTNEDGTKVIIKKAPRQRQQAPTDFDSDDGFQKATNVRKKGARENEKDEYETEETPGWNRQ